MKTKLPPEQIESATAKPAAAKPRAEADPLNLPNVLTAFRFVLAIVLFVMIAIIDSPGERLWWLVVFVMAAFTDWLDGFLARRLDLGSTLGRNLDPLVDKILMCGAFIFLIPIEGSGVAPWIVAVVVARELAVTSLRSFIENRGGSFSADWLGKLKMVLQCVTLFYVLMYLYLTPGVCPIYNQYIPQATTGLLIRDIALYAMVVVTVLSGLQYLWKAGSLLGKPSEEATA